MVSNVFTEELCSPQRKGKLIKNKLNLARESRSSVDEARKKSGNPFFQIKLPIKVWQS